MPRPKNESGCSEPGCTNKHLCKNLCQSHYDKLRLQRIAESDKACSVEGCDGYMKFGKLCHKHYMRMHRTGSLELLPKKVRVNRRVIKPSQRGFVEDLNEGSSYVFEDEGRLFFDLDEYFKNK